MSIEAEIDARIKHLRDPRVTWVKHTPHELFQSCLVWDGIFKSFIRGFSRQACNFVEKIINNDAQRTSLETWNDAQESVEVVIQVLEKARAYASELGV
jgi:hypothetical protein